MTVVGTTVVEKDGQVDFEHLMLGVKVEKR